MSIGLSPSHTIAPYSCDCCAGRRLTGSSLFKTYWTNAQVGAGTYCLSPTKSHTYISPRCPLSDYFRLRWALKCFRVKNWQKLLGMRQIEPRDAAWSLRKHCICEYSWQSMPSMVHTLVLSPQDAERSAMTVGDLPFDALDTFDARKQVIQYIDAWIALLKALGLLHPVAPEQAWSCAGRLLSVRANPNLRKNTERRNMFNALIC